MKVLALELSSAAGSVAVAENGRIVTEVHFVSERGRGAEVFAALEATRSSWQGADIIALGIGPGSYNGLRTACAIATSLQMAGSASVRMAPSACLLPTETEHFFVCGDARGGCAYRAEVRGRRLVGDIAMLPYAEEAAAAGGTPVAYRVGSWPGSECLEELSPEARVLALLSPDLPVVPAGPIEPIYLKPPHITLPRPDLPAPRAGC